MRTLRWNLLLGSIGAALTWLLRLTVRYGVHDDPRPRLRAQGRGYAYALLHAHQANAVVRNDEPLMAAMVSRSRDGDLLVPTLHAVRVVPARGSSAKRNQDKGGRAALGALMALAMERIATLIAVDGPRGPRNHVAKGIARLAVDTGAVVLPVCVIASRKAVLSRTWDRLQVPAPFSRIDLCFGEPIDPREHGPEEIRARVRSQLWALERRWDPEEWSASRAHLRRRAARDPATAEVLASLEGGAEA